MASPHAVASAFVFGASGDPMIMPKSVFSSTIVSTLVTATGCAAAVPQAARLASVGGGGGVAAPAAAG